LNETGWDILGSDEIIVRYLADRQSRFTGVYGSVDTGDTHTFRSQQRCMTRAIDPDGTYNHTWACDPAGTSGPISFGIEFFELDGFLRGLLLEPTRFCISAGSDDLHSTCDRRLQSLFLARAQTTYSEAEPAAAMPAPGASVTRMVPIGSDYQVNLRITRTDAGTISPPEVVPTSPIQLQATVQYRIGGARIALTWSGATTSTVDLYVNGVLVANTPNDRAVTRGSHPGTFVLRICNAGSTVCSATGTVTVNPA
jgi:hypothetical protein